jgi:hypothetical protein
MTTQRIASHQDIAIVEQAYAICQANQRRQIARVGFMHA